MTETIGESRVVCRIRDEHGRYWNGQPPERDAWYDPSTSASQLARGPEVRFATRGDAQLVMNRLLAACPGLGIEEEDSAPLPRWRLDMSKSTKDGVLPRSKIDVRMPPGAAPPRDAIASEGDGEVTEIERELAAALRDVVRIADRKTLEFDRARAVLAKATERRL